MQDLRIAYCQGEVAWHDWSANRAHYEKVFSQVSEGTHLVLLPEMFTSGFTMEPESVAATIDGEEVHWMIEQASRLETVLMGSLVMSDDGKYYNRLMTVYPDGTYSYYDKKHLFTYARENEHYTAGDHRLVVEIAGWRVCPLVCYDLRFPVWSRYKDDYDVLVYVANWPAPRVNAWSTLLRARAIENQCYVIGVNRTGTDATGLNYTGQSAVIDPLGIPVYSSDDQPDIGEAILKWDSYQEFRRKYNFLADKDAFLLG